jgi:hypothetical protein
VTPWQGLSLPEAARRESTHRGLRGAGDASGWPVADSCRNGSECGASWSVPPRVDESAADSWPSSQVQSDNDSAGTGSWRSPHEAVAFAPGHAAARIEALRKSVAPVNDVRPLQRLTAATSDEIRQFAHGSKDLETALKAAGSGGVAAFNQLNTAMSNYHAEERGQQSKRVVAERGPDRHGVPIAELALNQEMPLAAVAGGSMQIGVVAGA